MTSQFPFSFEEISKSPEITDFEELRFVNRFGLNLTYFRFTVQSPVAKIIFMGI